MEEPFRFADGRPDVDPQRRGSGRRWKWKRIGPPSAVDSEVQRDYLRPAGLVLFRLLHITLAGRDHDRFSSLRP